MSHQNFQFSFTFLKLVLAILLTNSISYLYAQTTSVLWHIDNLSQIGGNSVQVVGNPKIIQTEIGDAIEFDGVDDGLIVNNNPMAGVSAFTIEIIFKPYTNGAIEQRFLHFQQDDNNRILIELRNTNNTNWSLDTFIKSGNSNKTLLDYSFAHNFNAWSHAALVYENGVMKHYVNGNKELEDNVTYQVVNSGETALGMRLNQVSWFKGAIRAVKVTNSSVNPEEFMTIESALSIKKTTKNNVSKHVFPNPLVASAKLKYQLQASSRVTIKMLNVLGEEVSHVFEGFQTTGAHELEINRNNLKAGLYFLVINANNSNTTQKIIISN